MFSLFSKMSFNTCVLIYRYIALKGTRRIEQDKVEFGDRDMEMTPLETIIPGTLISAG